MYFEYGPKEIDYLKSRDKKLAAVIDRVGHIEREVDTDMFSAVVHHIVGQQISTKAQATVWQRMRDMLGDVDADSITLCRHRQASVMRHDVQEGRVHYRFCA